MPYIVRLTQKNLPASVGNKALNLRLLADKGFPVPVTYVCTWEAHQAYLETGVSVLDTVRVELENIISNEYDWAVRSSADVEDSYGHSFAGQFNSVLDVSDVDEILGAVEMIWETSRSEMVQTYMENVSGSSTKPQLAVIVQEMVKPVLSGVAFSKNPITALDEIVIEAVAGSGELLVQQGVNPMRWINKWGGWITQPEENDEYMDAIEEVAAQTQRIASTFKRDIDLEWVFDGEKVYWIQLRDMTAVGQTNIYSNRIAKEMIPGLVPPLVWSVSIPIPSKVWADLLLEISGNDSVDPASLMKAFYYQAYMNIGVLGGIFESLGLPSESLEMMLGIVPPEAGKPPVKPSLRTIKQTPRLMKFAWDKWHFAKKAERDYPELRQQSKQFSLTPSSDLSEQDVLAVIDQIAILDEKVTYYTVICPLLMQSYDGAFRSRLRKIGVDPQQFDLTEDMPELKRYDPTVKLEVLNQQFRHMDPALQQEIKDSDFQRLQHLEGAQAFYQDICEFLAEFGHLSDTTGHFGSPCWRETPDLVLSMVTEYQKPKEHSQQKISMRELEEEGKSNRVLRLLFKRARQFRLLREMYSSLFSYTVNLFRVYYLLLGQRLVQQGLLAAPEDILYLYDDEVRAYISGKDTGSALTELAAQRSDEMDRYKDLVLPQVIFGDIPPPVVSRVSDRLNGIPTSRGYYTGRIKVIKGIGEFGKLEEGEVLVIPFSDVSWTPLFTKAGAVVAESGGMLSHSSIVAREYGIPAVVSVPGVCQLSDQVTVTVDGYKGEIIVHDLTEASPY